MPTPRRNSVVNDSANFVRARLLALIEGGSLPADGRLPTERELSEGMDVGRRAVRAALESLLAEGLIWRKQGKGTFAGQPPDKTQLLAAEIVGETSVVDVMEARLCIEPVLAAMAARHALPDDIDRMRNLAQRILQAAEPDTIELWDGALHRLIAASPSALLGVSLADVTGERRSQNQPGTVDEYPNWRVPLADARGKVVLVEDLVDHDGFARLARAVSGDTSPVE